MGGTAHGSLYGAGEAVQSVYLPAYILAEQSECRAGWMDNQAIPANLAIYRLRYLLLCQQTKLKQKKRLECFTSNHLPALRSNSA